MARKRTMRRGGKADGGSAWISYSDMMAALLLVFVLVLCYSMYQYFAMLDTKTAELNQQSALLTAKQTELDSKQTELNNQQLALIAKESELSSALTQLEEQKGLLSDQNLTLEEQKKLILAAQTALSQKETELATANAELESKQNELANATILLGQQQDAMNAQQQKLDQLVGVRTQIVRELTSALSKAQLKAKVDPNTGDIMLESNVFFDTGKSAIKAEGSEFLKKFIPVYLGVLLQDEYRDYLGEIIIEGHTDTSGTYLSNLKLSQERALSVATACLQMPGLTDRQVKKLKTILTATGRSSSVLIYNEDGSENMDASRRVEFKFRMKDAEMVDEIRRILSGDGE
ncbi:MAG: OmpA family protein [Clostridiales bacterium]|nr:OmpA family protein [Clostridiales bacterium]